MNSRSTEHPTRCFRLPRLPAVGLVIAVVAWPGSLTAQEPTAEEMQKIVQRQMEASMPGPEHERLATMQGTWDVETRIWQQPGAEPIVAAGTTEAKMVLGGRFLVQTGMYSAPAPPIELMAVIGFDRRADEYTLVGFDTSGTYWVSGQGPANAAGDETVLAGVDHDPISGADQVYDFVLRWVDEDTFVTQVVFKDDIHTRGGPPFKMVESTARRRH